jgi:hypothetical protein
MTASRQLVIFSKTGTMQKRSAKSAANHRWNILVISGMDTKYFVNQMEDLPKKPFQGTDDPLEFLGDIGNDILNFCPACVSLRGFLLAILAISGIVAGTTGRRKNQPLKAQYPFDISRIY